MGSGALCQRRTQPNLQLAAGVELDASRLFRYRMYQQHGFINSIRRKSSSEGRTSNDPLLACVVDNNRFSNDDEKQINNYTFSHLNQITFNKS